MKLHGLLGATLVVVLVACAQAATDVPEDEAGGDGGTSSGSTLPPSNPSDSGSTSSSSGGSSSSSGSTKTDSGSQSSGGSDSGAVPACPFANDIPKLLAKLAEIQAGAPCDSSCNVTTHCCLDLLGGSSGLPIEAGTGTGGVCVTKN